MNQQHYKQNSFCPQVIFLFGKKIWGLKVYVYELLILLGYYWYDIIYMIASGIIHNSKAIMKSEHWLELLAVIRYAYRDNYKCNIRHSTKGKFSTKSISSDRKIKLLDKIKLLFILIHHIQNIFVNPYLYQVNMSISVRVYL